MRELILEQQRQLKESVKRIIDDSFVVSVDFEHPTPQDDKGTITFTYVSKESVELPEE